YRRLGHAAFAGVGCGHRVHGVDLPHPGDCARHLIRRPARQSLAMATASAPRCIAALDQGTTSTRCILFDHDGSIRALARREHEQHFPQPGWVEHDATDILRNALTVVGEALSQAALTAS